MIWGIGLLLCFAAPLTAQDASTGFTLEKAIQYGLENNRQVKNAYLDVQIAKKKIWETTSMGLPQISGEVGYQHFIDLPVSVAPAEAFGGPPGEFAELKFGTKNNVSAGITVSQLLFSGEYLIGLQAAKTYARYSEEQKKKTDIDIRDAITTSYIQALMAKRNREVLEENQQQIAGLVKEIKAMHEAGFVDGLDVDILVLQEAQLNDAVAKSKAFETTAADLLKLQMGYPQDQSITFEDELKTLAEAALSASAFPAFDVNSQIDVKLAISGEALSLLEVKRQKSTRYPTLAGFLNHSQNAYRNQFNFFNNGSWYPTTIAGLTIQIPIFDSRGQASRIKQAQFALEQVGNTRKLLEDKANMEYQSALTSWNASLSAFKTAKNNLQLAERILERMTIRHKEGLATSTELIQTQNQLITTKIAYYNASAELLLARARIQKLLNQ